MKLGFRVKGLFLSLILLCIQIQECKGCIKTERLALLEFKASFIESYDIDLLPSWVDDPESNCCEWERVTCNSTTNHVIELALNRTRFDLQETINPLINITMLQVVEELRSLDLSNNGINDFIEHRGFEELSNLMKLETLNLGGNYFDNTIMASVGTIVSLKTLILSENYIRGTFPIKELANLENLEVLDLRWNELNKTPTIQDLGSFPKVRKLKYLDLSNNDLDNNTLSFLSIFPSLKSLGLSSTRFQQTNFQQDFCRLKKLEELDLSDNNLEGGLPQCLLNFTSLKILDLSGNKFTGQIYSSWIANLTFLKYIDLSNNLFEGSFSFQEFANHSFLEVVRLDHLSTNHKLKFVTRYPGWIPSFQLQILSLQNCGLDRIPEFLFHQSKLKLIDLSHNKIKENFPRWLVKNNTGLRFLDFKNNSFSGQIHLHTNISYFDVSDNNFSGLLQEKNGKVFPNMKFLDLSRNHFQGQFPFSPDNDCELENLNLSYNNFTEEIPEQVVSKCNSLNRLKLSYNNFQGEIFTGRFNLTNLIYFHLNNNQFVGSLSSTGNDFNILHELMVFDISNNRFYGQIPRWIGNLTNLDSFILHNNFFIGSISCIHLSFHNVDLSYNSFSGILPSCSSEGSLSGIGPLFINLQGNKFNGSVSKLFLNSSQYLKILDLRDNNLSGSISKSSFGEFSYLKVLSLAGNHINGFIPKWLCELNELKILDLSRNSLSGPIPHCLCNLSFSGQEFTDSTLFSTIEGGETLYTGSLLGMGAISSSYVMNFESEVQIEFVTKYMSYTYGNKVLGFMSGLDLSDNALTGEIPHELGMLSQIHALNLSRNQLTGHIPKSFSNLSEIESLDLSFNNLSGQIPSELAELHSIAVFSVADNNLSGRVPDRLKGQFITFDKSSYEGNQFLCGPPLEDCSYEKEFASLQIPSSYEDEEEKWYEIDHVIFFASFSVSFSLFFVAVITLLYINPYWRQIVQSLSGTYVLIV